MPTFIDESGDTGHARDSLPYFRLAALWMASLEEAEAFRQAVRDLRRGLNLKGDYEFKFARTRNSANRRRAFLNLAVYHRFKFAVCAIDKTTGPWSNATSRQQHWAAATSIAVDLRRVYLEAEKPDRPLRDQILVDDNGDRDFLAAIERAFRGLRSRLHPATPMVLKPRFRASRADEVMQLVDMVCGASGAAVDGDSTWFDLVRDRCVALTRLP